MGGGENLNAKKKSGGGERWAVTVIPRLPPRDPPKKKYLNPLYYAAYSSRIVLRERVSRYIQPEYPHYLHYSYDNIYVCPHTFRPL
jgi:hypothetical protein